MSQPVKTKQQLIFLLFVINFEQIFNITKVVTFHLTCRKYIPQKYSFQRVSSTDGTFSEIEKMETDDNLSV